MKNKRIYGDWGAISCEYAHTLVKKQRSEDLDPFERNGLFAHCTICDSCRELQLATLNELLDGWSLDDVLEGRSSK